MDELTIQFVFVESDPAETWITYQAAQDAPIHIARDRFLALDLAQQIHVIQHQATHAFMMARR